VDIVEGERVVLDPRPIAREVVNRVLAGDPAEHLAARFHDTVVQGLSRLVIKGATRVGADEVVLTGGCMLNRYLAGGLVDELEHAGLRALVPRLLPVGDGGISLGQAAVAAWQSGLAKPAGST
jgi:hydrogenase maturation protein HypF